MNKNKIETGYIYDTPAGIVEKEGKMLRGMVNFTERSFLLRGATIFVAILMLILPGVFFSFIGISAVFSVFFGLIESSDEVLKLIPISLVGLLLLSAGVRVCYKNIK